MRLLSILFLVALSPAETITLTEVNSFILPQFCSGMDVIEYPGTVALVIVDSENDYLSAYWASSAEPAGTMSLDSDNKNAFGVCWTGNDTPDSFYLNDALVPNLFHTDNAGLSWTTFTNPSGTEGRGMDFDGTWCWSTSGTNALFQFQPGGVLSYHTLPEITQQVSGLSVFPYQEHLGIAIACYLSPELFFYRWDGNTLAYMGSASLPASVKYSLGLAWSETNNCLYWSFLNENTTSGYSVLALTITSLSRDTWAGIKTSFRN